MFMSTAALSPQFLLKVKMLRLKKQVSHPELATVSPKSIRLDEYFAEKCELWPQ